MSLAGTGVSYPVILDPGESPMLLKPFCQERGSALKPIFSASLSSGLDPLHERKTKTKKLVSL